MLRIPQGLIINGLKTYKNMNSFVWICFAYRKAWCFAQS